MIYHKSTLKNGLRVLTIPMPSVESVTVTVWVRTGSRFEDKRMGGISHFLEHMGFKGGQKYQTSQDVAIAVDQIGAQNNASTGKEYTDYYIKTQKGKVEKAFDILSDMLISPQLRSVDIDRERKVILEEYAMYQDTPLYHVGDIFENLIYKNSILGMDIIGTPVSIKNIAKNDFLSYRKTHYIPKNMLITVAGNITHPKAVNLSKKYFSSLTQTTKVPSIPVEEFTQITPQTLLEYKKTDQAHIMLGFRTEKMGTKDRYVHAVLSTILGKGMSSRLFTEVREKRGLAYNVSTSSDATFDNGYMATHIGTTTAKAPESIKVVLDEHYKLAVDGLPAQSGSQIAVDELSKAKEYLKGHIALGLESTSSVGGFFGRDELLLGKPRQVEEVYAGINKVTTADVTRVAKKYFNPENLNLAIIGPYKSTAKFDKIIT